jgi:hypothetical protein
MRICKPQVFGKIPWDNTPVQWSLNGQQGWWRLPNAWFARRNEDGTMTGSPNADFSSPCYDLILDVSGYLVFQDLGRSTQAGLMSPAQH